MLYKACKKKARMEPWGRFLVGGCLNTIFTYGTYRALILIINYQLAYFIVYILAFLFTYCFNSALVFKVKLSWRGLFAYPLAYIIHYGISVAALEISVKYLGLSEGLAPLLILIVMTPIMYVLSKWIIAPKTSRY